MVWAATAWPKEMAFTTEVSEVPEVPAVSIADPAVSKAGPIIVPVGASGDMAGSVTVVVTDILVAAVMGAGATGEWQSIIPPNSISK